MRRDDLSGAELRAYELGWRDALVEFNAAVADFAENMKHDQPLARRVMKERLTIAMQIHGPATRGAL